LFCGGSCAQKSQSDLANNHPIQKMAEAVGGGFLLLLAGIGFVGVGSLMGCIACCKVCCCDDYPHMYRPLPTTTTTIITQPPPIAIPMQTFEQKV
jgi:hypothetical protein